MSRIFKMAMMAVMALPACTSGVPGAMTPTSEDARLVEGPPIEIIVTSLDAALRCMKGKIGKDLAFSVGTIADNTGKEAYADNGSGKFITQGAGDIVQSALFMAGVTVVNRRDPNIALAESNWGIRLLDQQTASDFYITGSINSLDFIPGGGGRVEVAGVGPRYRQSRILIGLDLALTTAYNGEIVGNSSVQKQIYVKELGFGVDRFEENTLLGIEAGGMEREAMHFALRQILNYTTFDLLAQVASKDIVTKCAALIEGGGPSTILPIGPGMDRHLQAPVRRLLHRPLPNRRRRRSKVSLRSKVRQHRRVRRHRRATQPRFRFPLRRKPWATRPPLMRPRRLRRLIRS